jgi:hypothetical protein
MDQRVGNVFQETRTNLTKLSVNEYNKDGGLGVSATWALDLEYKSKATSMNRVHARPAGWYILHAWCTAMSRFPIRSPPKIALTLAYPQVS